MEKGLSERWSALVRYDDEIRSAAQKLSPFGDHWVEEFGRAYFALNEDRKYLPNILDRLLDEANHAAVARAEQERRDDIQAWLHKFRCTADGQASTENTLAILLRAEALGYSLDVTANRTFTATRGGATSYLRSNYDVERFGEFLKPTKD